MVVLKTLGSGAFRNTAEIRECSGRGRIQNFDNSLPVPKDREYTYLKENLLEEEPLVARGLFRLHGLRGSARTGGITRGLGDTAHIIPSGHANVPVLAPRTAPRILYLPVIVAIVCAVSHGEHAVVQLRSTRVVVEHTAVVELEGLAICLNGYGDWANRYGTFQRVLVVWGHVLVTLDGDDFGAAASAGPVLAGVGQFFLGADASILDDEVEGIVHEATLTAFVCLVAID